jgi:hypothetical protein
MARNGNCKILNSLLEAVLFEKLNSSTSQKFPALYGTVEMTDCHLSLTQARLIQFMTFQQTLHILIFFLEKIHI